MTIAGVYLRDFEPFNEQALEFKPKVSPDLADVHFFVGQNGTGKTRLLSLLASACGNPDELKFRAERCSSSVIVNVTWNGAPQLRTFLTSVGGVHNAKEPLPLVFAQIRKNVGNPSSGMQHISESLAMAFRSTPSLEDQKVVPMGAVKWAEPRGFLRFDHHSTENAQLCQALANLKVRMGIVSSDPKDRAVRMVTAFDKAIQSITSQNLVLTVGYAGQDFKLKVSWDGKESQLKQLPDGLRSIIGWLASVVCKLDMLLPEVDSPLEHPVILLLDEPDAYLHPAWQRKLIPAVQRLLPNAQIFVATHSPFVISSVNAGWIYVFEADADGKVTIKPPVACELGDSYIDVVEDVLGIKERFDPETEQLLSDFRKKRDAIKRPPTEGVLQELQTLAEAIAKRGPTLQFMMGREMTQLRAQPLAKTA